MRKSFSVGVIVVMAFLASSCGSGVSEANISACETFDFAHKNVEDTVALAIANEHDDYYKNLAQVASSKRPGLIKKAYEQSEGELASDFQTLAGMASRMDATEATRDAAIAYYMSVPDIIEACQEAGAEMESAGL